MSKIKIDAAMAAAKEVVHSQPSHVNDFATIIRRHFPQQSGDATTVAELKTKAELFDFVARHAIAGGELWILEIRSGLGQTFEAAVKSAIAQQQK